MTCYHTDPAANMSSARRQHCVCTDACKRQACHSGAASLKDSWKASNC